MSLTQKRLPEKYKTFSARRLPQALRLPFLSILAALFVPLLGDQRGEGDETAKFYMIKR